MAVVACINLKGGVAKTTNAVAIAEALHETGRRVLVIDADHQCMASELLLGQDAVEKANDRERTFYDLVRDAFSDDADLDDFSYYAHGALAQTEAFGGLDVMPCSMRMDDLSSNLALTRRGMHATSDEFQRFTSKRRQTFRKWLRQTYDYTIIDCPPSMAQQVKFLMPILDAFIIPCVPDRLCVRGAQHLMDKLARKRQDGKGIGLLWTLYRKQMALHGETLEQAKRRRKPFDVLPKPFETVIPNATAIANASREESRGKDLGDRYGTAAPLFRQLATEVVRRCDAKQAAKGVSPSAGGRAARPAMQAV